MITKAAFRTPPAITTSSRTTACSGLQIGADMKFRKCRWAWGVEAKIGPLHQLRQPGQHDRRASIVGLPDHDVSQRLRGQRDTAALIGEVGFPGHLQVPAESGGPRRLRLHVGLRRCPGPRTTPVRRRSGQQDQHQRHDLLSGRVVGTGVAVVTRCQSWRDSPRRGCRSPSRGQRPGDRGCSQDDALGWVKPRAFGPRIA